MVNIIVMLALLVPTVAWGWTLSSGTRTIKSPTGEVTYKLKLHTNSDLEITCKKSDRGGCMVIMGPFQAEGTVRKVLKIDEVVYVPPGRNYCVQVSKPKLPIPCTPADD